MIGNLIGRYKILRFIGEGGMASVYEGEHETLGTKAAIKILNPILSANQQIRQRFKNEAKMMATLDHPNIIRVLDYEESDTFLAITMEMLAGKDMNDHIKEHGKLAVDLSKEIFSQVLSAFSYAHNQGIVHRDVKPSNIFLLPDGKVKILDFGIAKLFGQGNEMTQTGTQMGTPMYMSPEQVKGDKSVDHRSDIYSLGVTMYYALNGKPPYDSNTSSQFDIFSKIVYEPLSFSSMSGELIPFIQKACEKDREQRFQNCEEWLEAIKNDSIIALNVGSLEKTKFESINDKSIVEPIAVKTVIEKSEQAQDTPPVALNTSSQKIIQTHEFVSIGSQVWSTENLNVSTFRNGEIIPEAKTAEEWEMAGENKQAVWCYYANDPSEGTKYGKLYNFYAATDPRGLAPFGYHIPSDAEWTMLSENLGGAVQAGHRIKSKSGWKGFIQYGNNDSGFSGLPGGYRSEVGFFYKLNSCASWWSSSQNESKDALQMNAWCRDLDYGNSYLNRFSSHLTCGKSVRCVKD